MKIRRSNKYLCLVLTLILAANIGVSSVMAAGADDAATNTLSAIGVITPDASGSYNQDIQVTRAEYSKMIISASVYKDTVPAAVSTVFKDVPASHWAAGYVKLAVTNGLLSGYSDGTFRPQESVKTEQAVNAVLKLLGYTTADFRGSFPEAQMSIYRSSTLSLGIAAQTGSFITRGDAIKLIYNMLNTKIKDGSKKFAETLGYALNSSGEIDYAALITGNMSGPYTAKTTWMSDLSLTGTAFSVYKNGKLASLSDVKTYDIIYINDAKTMLWIYDKKITGVFERANPSQNDLTSVVLSGTEYKLESSAAFTALSSSGNLRVGNTITLLIGKDGGVADAVSSALISENTVLYITEKGTKTYKNANDQEYNASYIKGVTVAGDIAEYPVTQTWMNKGDVVKVDFKSGSVNVGKATGGNISGIADADLSRIGQTQLTDDVRIMDTFDGAYTSVSMQRLDGVRIDANKVLYYAASAGRVSAIILNGVTGDLHSYGIMTKADVTSQDGSGGFSVSGSYTWLLDGNTKTFSTQNSAFAVNLGPVMLQGAADRPDKVKSLTNLSAKVQSIEPGALITSGNIERWPISDKVSVYTATLEKTYTQCTLSDLNEAFAKNQTINYYYNELPENGGQIRVIIIRV